LRSRHCRRRSAAAWSRRSAASGSPSVRRRARGSWRRRARARRSSCASPGSPRSSRAGFLSSRSASGRRSAAPGPRGRCRN